MQRLRVRFARGEELKFISHLDITRLWQRAFERSDIPLAYSQGFNPHPQISLAAPLPVGVTSSAELMDILCYQHISPSKFLSLMADELPRGMEILEAYQVPLPLPSLQSELALADYEVTVLTEKSQEGVLEAIENLLVLASLPWQHKRDTGVRRYDLRPLINEIRLISFSEGLTTIGMRLRSDSTGTGRPEQVSLALGFEERPRLIHRTRLILKSDLVKAQKVK